MYISEDEGHSWEWQNTSTRMEDLYSVAINGSHWYFGSRGKLYVSENNGLNWYAVYPPMYEYQSVDRILSVNETTLLMTTGEGIFKSTDTGKNWTPSDT